MRFLEQQREARQSTWRLLLIFAATVLVLVLAVNGGLWAAWWLLSAGWRGRQVYIPGYFFEVNTGVTLFFVLGGWWIESSNLSRGGEAVARRCGARELRSERDPQEQLFGRIVTEMAIAAHMPVPTPMVITRQWQINAFAAGNTPRDAVIAITDGALQELDRAELQGLVAHELSHIAEGDIVLNTRLCGMVFGLEMVFRFGQHLVQMRGSSGSPTVFAIFGMPVMAVGSLGWVAGRLLCAAVSRQREFLADARAVQWTRHPDGLAGVLRKIQYQQDHDWQREDNDTPPPGLADFDAFARQQPMITHMLLAEPTSAGWTHWLAHMLSSHPPLDERIRRVYGVLDT